MLAELGFVPGCGSRRIICCAVVGITPGPRGCVCYFVHSAPKQGLHPKPYG